MCFAKRVLEQSQHASVSPWIITTILSMLAFQSCWFTACIWFCGVLANSKPDALFGHLTCSSHPASITDLFVVTSCVLETHFCRAFPHSIWWGYLIYQQWSVFFPSFSLWAQFCSWGQADGCWCTHGVLLASERQGVGEDICLGRVTRPRLGSSSVSCHWGEQKPSFPDMLQ